LSQAKYDIVVIGAGIAGISTAYWLNEAGKKVLLLEKDGLLSGASGAAGAFLSPRLGKGGDLQKITNRAYLFALDFYKKTVLEGFYQRGLVRIPKDKRDAGQFEIYKRYLDLSYIWCESKDFPFISSESMQNGAFFFDHSAFVDPLTIAKKLISSIEVIFDYEAKPFYKDDFWHIGEFLTKNIVFATGAESLPVDIPYITIGGVWGERVDVKTSAKIPVTIHKKLSVSPNIDGVVRIGATHVRNDPRSEIERVNQLIKDAIELIPDLKDQELIKIYSGHRSAVNDHFPIVGNLADINESKNRFKAPYKNIKPESEEIPYLPGCYIIGGFGGRGFVFAPLVGKMLADKILKNQPLESTLSSDRYLVRYLRKSI